MNKYQKRALGSSYFFLVFGITLVLFILGFWCMLVLGAKVFSDNIREKFTMTISLKNSASDIEIKKFISSLKKDSSISRVKFIDKETSAKELKKELGEDFIGFLGYNPLFNTIEINLKSDYANPTYAKQMKKKLAKDSNVKDISYSKYIINQIYNNFKYLNWVLLGISLFFIMIASILINSYIRLTIYTKRFIIMTMYLVGATRFFILIPFVLKMLRISFISTFLAVLLLSGIVYYAFINIPFIFDREFVTLLSLIVVILFIVSSFITSAGTYCAVRNFLRSK